MFITDNYTRKAKVRKIIDGDTIEVMVDNGHRKYSIERLRFQRFNAPEITKPETREAGMASKIFVQSKLKVDDEINITTFKDKDDAFGRWLAEVYYVDLEGIQRNLNDDLFNGGYAVIYVRK
jgi:micrococcal nuclease